MEIFKAKFKAMGGGGELTIAAKSPSEAETASLLAIAEIERIEEKYTRYKKTSVIGQINHLAGTGIWTACDNETRDLLAIANHLYQLSDGLFDITSGILRKAWVFDNPSLPEPTQVRHLCTAINWPCVELGDQGIRLSAGMEIDFGGFGKEYASDQVAKVLQQNGYGHGMINLGGDIRIIGPQPDGSPWVVGIQDPRQPEKLLASIPLSRGALATSGDYERYFELDGKRYCHILNPKTGYPVNHWRSISIFAPSALIAGSHSTIGMLKESDAIKFLKQTGLKFLAIDQHSNISQY